MAINLIYSRIVIYMEITFTVWIYKVRKISISDSFLGGKQKRLMNFGRKYTSIKQSIYFCRSLWNSITKDSSSCISVNVISNAEDGAICSDF